MDSKAAMMPATPDLSPRDRPSKHADSSQTKLQECMPPTAYSAECTAHEHSSCQSARHGCECSSSVDTGDSMYATCSDAALALMPATPESSAVHRPSCDAALSEMGLKQCSVPAVDSAELPCASQHSTAQGVSSHGSNTCCSSPTLTAHDTESSCNDSEPGAVRATPDPLPAHKTPRRMALQQIKLQECLPLSPAASSSECYSAFEHSAWQSMHGWYRPPMPYDIHMDAFSSYWNAVDGVPFQTSPPQHMHGSHWHQRLGRNLTLCDNCGSVVQCGHKNTDETRTSIMLKGLPETYKRSTVLQLLETEGFSGSFDFVYVPIEFKQLKILGYVLINLVSPTEALRFFKHFEGFSDWGLPCDSIGTVAWCSPTQGLKAQIERYRNSPVMHESVPEEWRPLLFACGVPKPFPAPTMTIKAPRLKRLQ